MAAAEAGQALGDIGRVADLAELAIADDADAGLDLGAHGILDLRLHECVERRLGDLDAVVALQQHGCEFCRPGQAADMGRVDESHGAETCKK